ncbi:hypothetical protein [Nocardia gipuzkoensis]|uniref:hypothetical protein n=1 Tax=Nocardia gipuzkoensis TaxID=2749991 RepID=UPI003EDEA84D
MLMVSRIDIGSMTRVPLGRPGCGVTSAWVPCSAPLVAAATHGDFPLARKMALSPTVLSPALVNLSEVVRHLQRHTHAAGPRGYLNQLILGGVIEAAVNWCAHNMRDRLNALAIPATYDFQPTGTHSWGYWQEALKKSWPVLADGLGLPQ